MMKNANERFGEGMNTFDSLGVWTGCCLVRCTIVRVMNQLLIAPHIIYINKFVGLRIQIISEFLIL